MGLVMTTIMAEVKYTNRTVAESQIIQTLNTVTNLWPKDSHTGFLIHFTNRNFQNNPKVGYSTVDSAELVLGALFAANYFKAKTGFQGLLETNVKIETLILEKTVA